MLLDTPNGELGWQAAEFTLKDPNGRPFTLAESMGDNGLLIAFICNHCPYVKTLATRLTEDANTLIADGVNVVAVMSNDYADYPEDSPENMLRFAERNGFAFPYLVDEDQSVGKAYGAVCTPDFFGFNAGGQLQYRGRLDDVRMGGDDNDRTRELVDAMQLVARTGKGPEAQTPSMGCSIKWR